MVNQFSQSGVWKVLWHKKRIILLSDGYRHIEVSPTSITRKLSEVSTELDL